MMMSFGSGWFGFNSSFSEGRVGFSNSSEGLEGVVFGETSETSIA
jgi:hypothetical protein